MNHPSAGKPVREALATHLEDSTAAGEHPGDLRFVGTREEELSCRVTVDGEPLAPRHDIRNHSPTGFEWGYGGSGPAQLALAILCRVAGADLAQLYYQQFKWQVVAAFPKDGWNLTGGDVLQWLLTAMEGRSDTVHDDGFPF